MSELYRTQVLLEREQHRALSEMATATGQSISEIIRQVIRQYLSEQEQSARQQQELAALDALAEMRQQLHEQHGLYQVDVLEKLREERVAELRWQGESES